MTVRSPFPMAALMGLVLVGCATPGTQIPQTAGNEGVVRGSVAYRERIALPPDAVVEVQLSDVSLQDVAAPVIAETTVRPEGRQVPLPFELRYDPSKIVPNHTYGVRATIRSAGQMIFTTDTAYHVITQGNPTQVDLMLVRVADSSDKPLGDWVVVGHRAPGVSAISDAEATALHGRTIRFGPDEAVSGADTCAHPVYKETETPADSYLSAQYHIRATDLGLENSQDLRLQVMEVFCGEKPWAAMGGVVLWVAEDRGFAVWEGVFFELRPASSPPTSN